jgi:GNAT superfamily N-acetyltransferase
VTGPTPFLLLADRPELIPEVGLLRWREWGYDDPSPDAWVETTRREAGRVDLPVTVVAVDDEGRALGAVALGDADDALTEDERAGRTPWLEGMVVRDDSRLRGIGRALVAALEDLARSRGHEQVWVVTGARAVDFYRACGWTDVEDLVSAKERLPCTVLVRRLAPE